MRQAVYGGDLSWTLTAWERGVREGPLDRAVTLLAAVAGIPREEAECAELGERDSLLGAALGGVTGGTVRGCVRCLDCGEQLDVPVDPAALPRTPRRDPGEPPLEVEAGGVRIRFRLPTTRDLRYLTGGDPAAARRVLLARCLLTGPENLTEEVAAAVEAAMEEASPGGALTLAVVCPTCGGSTMAAVDVPALLWAEVRARALALLYEVHVLAAAYGWTEPDVLALSPARRAAYLELVGG